MMKTKIMFMILMLHSLAVFGEVDTEDINRMSSDIRFMTADVMIDSGSNKLAAYQAEIEYNPETIRIVGIEGGGTDAFKEPPFYDRDGMIGGRIIIAAYIVMDASAPNGETRVATLHLQVKGEAQVRLTIKLSTAAEIGGKRIQPKAKIVLNKEQSLE